MWSTTTPADLLSTASSTMNAFITGIAPSTAATTMTAYISPIRTAARADFLLLSGIVTFVNSSSITPATTSMNCDSGWSFCCDLTNTLRFIKPRLLQNAEFWPGEVGNYPKSAPSIITSVHDGGAGFDVLQHDGLRGALRGAVESSAAGQQAAIDFDSIARALYPVAHHRLPPQYQLRLLFPLCSPLNSCCKAPTRRHRATLPGMA